VAVLVHQRLDVAGVGADEFAPAIVEAQAVLPAATLGPQVEGARIERKVAATQVQRRVGVNGWRFWPRRLTALWPGSGGRPAGAPAPGADEGRIDPFHFPAVGAGGAVNAVVERPGEGIEERLHVQFVRLERRVIAGESGEDHFPLVGHTVTVAILEVENVRRGP